jgi:NAD+ kinase
MKVALFGIRFDDRFVGAMVELLNMLDTHKVEWMVYAPLVDFLRHSCGIKTSGVEVFEQPLKSGDADYAFSIGGDGTFLETVTYVRDSGIPILGINSGRLGFLADTAEGDILKSIENLLIGNFRIDSLDLLCMESSFIDSHVNFALNEVAVTKRDSSSMITIHTYINGEFLNSYWADGIIIATPTGSTAYSLSVGGPLMHPASPNFLITPIAPHNLNVRPLVLPNNVVIDLEIEGRGEKFLASLDRRNLLFDRNCRMRIRKADFCINVIRFPDCSFFSTLRSKLMWGADRRK